MTETTLITFSRSLRNRTPINSANTMLTSRSAVTKAMGALVKAQVTSAYARKDAPPPKTNAIRPLVAMSRNVLGPVV